MKFAQRVARRYLFAKKSTNAINVISGISVFGISVGTATLIIVLSVFNGFEELLMGMFNAFNPDIKVIPTEGKTFSPDTLQLSEIANIEGIDVVARSLEEVAFFEFEESRDFGIIKGVDENFLPVTRIDTMVREGKFMLKDGERFMGVLGLGMRNKLSVSAGDFSLINVYMAKKKVALGTQAFRRKFLYPAGTFVIQQDFDEKYVLASLEFVQALLNTKKDLSALEIKLLPDADESHIKGEISRIMNQSVVIKNRYEQDEAFLKLMNLEKWLFFSLFSLAMILVAFNIVGALFMIVMDKQKDIGIRKSMVERDSFIKGIFMNQGLYLCGLGLLIGFVIAIILYILQKTVVLVAIPVGFVVDAYPIQMRVFDFVIVTVVVMAIGWLASLPAANRAAKVSPILREE